MQITGPFVPRDLLAAVAAGALWGVFCWWGDGSSLTFIRVLVNTAGPWVLLAFWAGARSQAALPGMVLGAAALLAAILGYYLSIELFDPAEAPYRVSFDAGRTWALAALPVGAVFGGLGAAWRADLLSPVALGLLGGVLFGEGLALLAENRTVELDYLVVPVAEIGAAFALPVLLTDRREAAWTILIVATVGPLVWLAERSVLETIRGVVG